MAIGGKTLTVYLAADVSKLRSGLNSADRSLSGFGDKLNRMVGPALIGAAAAAGTFAVALAVDGVQAAIQEEAELAKLSTTLNNLGFAEQTDEVNSFIDELQYASAVSDSTLRPAYSRLLTSVNDVTQAQKLLELALDVSAGTGKSLEAVTNALGKAYDGNLGALGKLGAGIDASTIKSKDLDGALAQLSTTFSGQASTAAGTLQGQMKILSISFDELKESFGTGFLNGMQGASGSLNEFSMLLRDSQEMAKDLGESVGKLAVEILQLTNDAWKAYKAFDAWTNNTNMGKVVGFLGDLLNLANPFSMLRKALEGVTGATDESTEALIANVNGLILWSNTAGKVDKYVRGGYGGIPITETVEQLETWRDRQLELLKPIEKTTKLSGGLTKAVKEMDPALRKQIDLVKSLTTQIGEASKAVETARKEMYDWQDQMANQITSGIDLGAAFGAQFDAEGKSTGQSLIDGFNKQIEQAGLFGGYLQTLNTQGGPELRDAVAALGPEIGNKLAKQIIDDGLVKTFQDKLVTVKSTARTAAEAMTPEFLVAGVQSAVNFLIGTQNALGAATSQLEEMGRAMGKTIGDAAAEEIRAALAAAGVAMSGGNATLGGVNGPAMSAEAAARVAAGGGSFASALSSTSIAQAIERAIFDSNQRLGRTGQAVLQ
jgi:hypothetical protein